MGARPAYLQTAANRCRVGPILLAQLCLLCLLMARLWLCLATLYALVCCHGACHYVRHIAVMLAASQNTLDISSSYSLQSFTGSQLVSSCLRCRGLELVLQALAPAPASQAATRAKGVVPNRAPEGAAKSAVTDGHAAAGGAAAALPATTVRAAHNAQLLVCQQQRMSIGGRSDGCPWRHVECSGTLSLPRQTCSALSIGCCSDGCPGRHVACCCTLSLPGQTCSSSIHAVKDSCQSGAHL